MPDDPITDLGPLPLVLMLSDISRIYRRAVATIRRDLQAGVFEPAPFAKFPYRWLKTDIEADLRSKSRAAHLGRLEPTLRERYARKRKRTA